ncbi:unnamed protein product [Paramecium sonneborni]|uniref:Uncharacterized protein n=1 Tax=Paramecium sonneborni TaxID=65129 RepID=A0A8S1RLT5_9CILI|nr:unnamed protein product [Paramecium sonneborni]
MRLQAIQIFQVLILVSQVLCFSIRLLYLKFNLRIITDSIQTLQQQFKCQKKCQQIWFHQPNKVSISYTRHISLKTEIFKNYQIIHKVAMNQYEQKSIYSYDDDLICSCLILPEGDIFHFIILSKRQIEEDKFEILSKIDIGLDEFVVSFGLKIYPKELIKPCILNFNFRDESQKTLYDGPNQIELRIQLMEVFLERQKKVQDQIENKSNQEIIPFNKSQNHLMMFFIFKQDLSYRNQTEDREYLWMLNIKVLEFKGLMKSVLSKMLNNIDQQINQIEKEVDLKEFKPEIKNLEEDVEILSNNYKGNFNYIIPVQQSSLENDIKFVDSLNQILNSIQNSSQYTQIIESLECIKQKNKKQEESQVNKITQREFDQQKASFLYQKCNKHSKKIVMVNLNQEDQELSQFACLDCVQEFPLQYITLEEANKRWILQKGQQEDLIHQYNLKRKNQYNNAVQIIKKLKDTYNQTLNEIIISLDKQLDNSNDDIFSTNKFSNTDLFQMDEKQLQQIIKLLSSKRLNQHIIEQQEKNDQQDLLFYSNLKTKLENLMKEDLLCKYQINKNLNKQQQIINQIIDDNKNALDSELHEFIQKSQMQEIYLTIFNESVESFKVLQKIYETLQKNGQLQQIMEVYQEKSQVKNLFKLFEHNFIRTKKLIMAEENEQQLDQATQQKQQLLIQIKELNDRNNQFSQKIIKLELEIKQINELFNCKLNEKKIELEKFILEIRTCQLEMEEFKKYQLGETKDLNNQILSLNSDIKKKCDENSKLQLEQEQLKGKFANECNQKAKTIQDLENYQIKICQALNVSGFLVLKVYHFYCFKINSGVFGNLQPQWVELLRKFTVFQNTFRMSPYYVIREKGKMLLYLNQLQKPRKTKQYYHQNEGQIIGDGKIQMIKRIIRQKQQIKPQCVWKFEKGFENF